MKKTWDVNVNGTVHTLEYKTGFGGPKITVNGQTYRAKSQNWFIVMVDYPIQIDGAELRVVAIGNKVDLSVNGVYLGSGEQYQPLHKVPAISNVFLGISCIGGFFLCGWLGLLIGILFGTIFYIRMGLKGKTGAVVGSFIACTVIQIIIFVIVLMVQLSGYYYY
ncbi:MAG: hypothetical protein ACOX8J_04855 [Candidatus Merdisoma sp.]|jgi:hypothetical protein